MEDPITGCRGSSRPFKPGLKNAFILSIPWNDFLINNSESRLLVLYNVYRNHVWIMKKQFLFLEIKLELVLMFILFFYYSLYFLISTMSIYFSILFEFKKSNFIYKNYFLTSRNRKHLSKYFRFLGVKKCILLITKVIFITFYSKIYGIKAKQCLTEKYEFILKPLFIDSSMSRNAFAWYQKFDIFVFLTLK